MNEMEYGKHTRREFLKWSGAAGAAIYGLTVPGCKSGMARGREWSGRKLKENNLRPGVASAHGKDPWKCTVAAIAAIGGMGKLVSRGDTVVVKPNMAWDRSPEQAANTNPRVVAALVKMCLDAGAGQVLVFDRPCNEASRTYKHSGIAAAAKAAGAAVDFVDDRRFVPVELKSAKTLRRWDFYEDILKADVFINVPIVKHHGSTGVTLGMKNIMGCAGGDRGVWHAGNIDQRIADANTAIRPDLVVVDAFHILMNHGPQGGSLSDVKATNIIAASTDIVAADAYGAKIFGVKPEDVKYIRAASDLGLGEMRLDRVKIHEVSA